VTDLKTSVIGVRRFVSESTSTKSKPYKRPDTIAIFGGCIWSSLT